MKKSLISLFSVLSLVLVSCKTSEKLSESSEELKNEPKIERFETILYVAPKTGDCMDGSPGECLFVKQYQNEEWQPIRNISEEFEYLPGYVHRIKVTMNSDYTDIDYIETIIQSNGRSVEPINGLNEIWDLFLFNSEKMEFPNGAPRLIINLEEHEFSGTGFCTEIMGIIHGDNPNHVEMEMRKVSDSECNELEEKESMYLGILNHVNGFKLEQDKLFLYINDEILLGYKLAYFK